MSHKKVKFYRKLNFCPQNLDLNPDSSKSLDSDPPKSLDPDSEHFFHTIPVLSVEYEFLVSQPCKLYVGGNFVLECFFCKCKQCLIFLSLFLYLFPAISS